MINSIINDDNHISIDNGNDSHNGIGNSNDSGNSNGIGISNDNDNSNGIGNDNNNISVRFSKRNKLFLKMLLTVFNVAVY